MTSCLFEGTVWHRRLEPRHHELRARIFLFCLDLDEGPALQSRLSKGVPLFGWEKPGLYCFRSADHFGKSGPCALKERLGDWLAGEGLPRPERVMLAAGLRFLGYVFNPLAIYYCYGEDGELFAAVAQVTNTFGEQKLYLCRPVRRGEGVEFQWSGGKEFYVSPFCDVRDEFQFRIRPPGERMVWAVNTLSGGRVILQASFAGQRRALTPANLLGLTARCPFVTLKIITLIHWHAFLLWLKRVPFWRKEEQPEWQRGILNPLGRPTPADGSTRAPGRGSRR